ncbi:MAG: hypothetical protein EOO45_03930 [Flavobacterium sp.]|nr:MAG: hypothetical protein EOO45_03930 [Flavobacterium sp.]
MVFQIVRSTVFLFIVYMIYAVMDIVEVETVNLVGLFTYQIVAGLTVTLLTVFCCILVGLPIRLRSRVNSFWRKNSFIWVGMLCLGIMLMVIAWNDYFSSKVHVEPSNIEKEIPNYWLSVTGWLFSAFALVHSYTRDAYIQLWSKLFPSWEY